MDYVDKSNFEELNQNSKTDNKRLEELMREDITPEMQREFLDLLKESQLLMPVTFSQDIFENLENAKVGDEITPQGQMGFSINYLEDNEGNRVVPLYTSEEAMEQAGVKSSVYGLYMSDLADMLRQTEKYSVISINPFTDHDINMPIQAFLGLFEEEDELMKTLNTMIKILKEKSQTLEDDYAFFVRESVDFMKEDAVEGVFTPNIPFNASTRKDFHGDKKYLNVLLMPKTSKILYIGDIVGEGGYDIVIAPGSEFHHVEDVDEYTRVWKCGAQPFYD